MFAFIALIIMILAFFKVNIGGADLFILAMIFFIAHFCFDQFVPYPARWRRNQGA